MVCALVALVAVCGYYFPIHSSHLQHPKAMQPTTQQRPRSGTAAKPKANSRAKQAALLTAERQAKQHAKSPEAADNAAGAAVAFGSIAKGTEWCARLCGFIAVRL